MKNLILRFALPLTFISFALITKWWYGVVIDGPDVFLYGFPMIYKCSAFHTSLATQYFLLELIVNLVTYFVFWLIIGLFINKIWTIHIPRKISILFWIGCSLVITGALFISYEFNDVYLTKRDFEVKIFDSGCSILEQTPDREKYLKEVQEWFEK